MKLPKIDTIIKKSISYQKSRNKKIEQMQEEAGYLFCEHCKRSSGFQKLHSHHIYFRSEKPKHHNLHHIDNLLILCETCHSKFHADKSIREKYIVERNLIELFK